MFPEGVWPSFNPISKTLILFNRRIKIIPQYLMSTVDQTKHKTYTAQNNHLQSSAS